MKNLQLDDCNYSSIPFIKTILYSHNFEDSPKDIF